MDQNEKRGKRDDKVRAREGKPTQSVKHVKLDLKRPQLTKEGKAAAPKGRERSRRRSFDSAQKDKNATLKIIPLGGLDAIGKNMTVFECGQDMILVDAGLMFPDDSQPGIDLVLPDYTYVLENEDKLRGIIITHGHEDHTGALPYLLQDLNNKVPIFSSKLTLGFIEGKLSEFRIRAPKFREVKGGSHVTRGTWARGCGTQRACPR